MGFWVTVFYPMICSFPISSFKTPKVAYFHLKILLFGDARFMFGTVGRCLQLTLIPVKGVAYHQLRTPPSRIFVDVLSFTPVNTSMVFRNVDREDDGPMEIHLNTRTTRQNSTLIIYMLLRNKINQEDLSNFKLEDLVAENVRGLPSTRGYIMRNPSALFASKPIKTH